MARCFKPLVFLDFILVLLFVFNLGADAARCPKSVVREAKRCMRKIGRHQNQDTLLSVLLPKNGTKELCRDGKIQEAFSCLNKLYSSCAKSRRGMRHLRMAVDVGKWQKAINNICHSMPYLEDIADCEVKAKREFEPCAKEANWAFKQNMFQLKMDFPPPLTPEVQGHVIQAKVDVTCELTSQILVCLEDPFEKYCPKKMAEIVRDTFKDFIPPACEKAAMQRSVKYHVARHQAEVGGSQQHGRPSNHPDLVSVVKQGDGHSVNLNNNRNDNNRNNNDRYNNKVDESSKNNNDDNNNNKQPGYGKGSSSSSSSFDEGAFGVKASQGHGVEGGGQKQPVSAGNVAEVRGKDNGSDGDGDNGPGGGGSSLVVAGPGSLLVVLSLTAAVFMVSAL